MNPRQLISELMRTSYRAEVPSVSEVSCQDPFGGCGTLIETSPGLSREEVTGMIEVMHPGRGYVLWDDCAWVDTGPAREGGEAG